MSLSGFAGLSERVHFLPPPYFGTAGAPSDNLAGLLQSDSPQTDNSFPMFEDSFDAREPVAMPEGFMGWLFTNTGGVDLNGNVRDTTMLDAGTIDGLEHMPPLPPQQPMDVRN